MTMCRLEKQKELAPTPKDSINKNQGNILNPDCSEEFRNKVKKAIEANDLCYNYETGFHYIKP